MKYYLIGLFFFASHWMSGQDLIKKIDSLSIVGNTRQSIDLALAYLEDHPNSRIVFYNTACRYARVNQLDSAFLFLETAMELNYKSPMILFDPDLEPLHDKQKWVAIQRDLTTRFKKKYPNIENYDLSFQLLALGKKDQLYRSAIHLYEAILSKESVDSLWRLQYELELSNLIEINRIIESQNGFPDKKSVGKLANRYCFLILQHSMTNPLVSKKQKKEAQRILKRAFKEGNLSAKYYAMFLDRQLRSKNKKQKFGTQYIKENGVKKHAPMIDIKAVNRKRKRLGLEAIKLNE